MLAPAVFALKALSQTLTAQEALSGIFGSISLATWIFLLVCRATVERGYTGSRGSRGTFANNPSQIPQLILNYKTRSADGISLAFLGVWLIGDITNLSGIFSNFQRGFTLSVSSKLPQISGSLSDHYSFS